MGKIAYLDCYSGISGDMFLGAMLDAGLDWGALREALAVLPVVGYRLDFESFSDKGIKGSRFHVELEKQEQPVRRLADIVALLGSAALDERVRALALAMFQHLAEAEATVHGTSLEGVHFHEVGAVDAIIDITGAAFAVTALGITQLYASPLPLTGGYVQAAHGILPIPAPATLEILRRAQAPWKACAIEGELVTPTGAAILATLARFETPAIAIERVGYGFGQKLLSWPNCLRLCLGTDYHVASAEGQELDTDWVTVLETNIDDMSGELLGGLINSLLECGALDASFTPIQMKKNRPAITITVICAPERSDYLAHVLLRETSTLGVRMQQARRVKAQRGQQEMETPLGPIRIKVKRVGGHVISAAPEYEDCQRIAREKDVALSDVYELANKSIEAVIITHKG